MMMDCNWHKLQPVHIVIEATDILLILQSEVIVMLVFWEREGAPHMHGHNEL